MNLEKQVKGLSDVYVTLQEIEIKSKFSMPMAMCLKTLENVINEMNSKKE